MPDHATASLPVAAGPRVRASHDDRAETVRRLQHALVEGRLDLAETDERVAAAFAARYDSELQPLLADLPPQPPAPDGAPSWSDLWVSAVWRARILVLGTELDTRPTPQHCRSAAALAALATLWMVLCALAGAAMVA